MPRKKKAKAEPLFDNPSFPDIESSDGRTTLEPDTADVKETKKDPQAELLASLQAQVASLTSRTEELQRTNMALMAAPVASGAGNTTVTPGKLDLTGLPDPGLDPEGYAQAVAQRTSDFISARQEANMKANNERTTKEGRINALWDDFAKQYEDYADPDKVDYVAQRVVKNMQARGVDPEKYMFGAKETFYRDVVTEYEKIFGKPESDDDDEPVTRTTATSDGDAPNRTGGIFGGLESGGGRSDGAQPQSDMLNEIQTRQRKSGFY